MNTAALSAALVGLIGAVASLIYAYAARLKAQAANNKANVATKALQDHLTNEHGKETTP